VSLSEAAATSEEILAELRSVMESEFGLEPRRIEPSVHLVEDLDLDSLDLVDLAVSLEDRTGLRIDEQELKSVRTVGDAVEAVQAALARRRTGAA
jgi:acyl carrier protein